MQRQEKILIVDDQIINLKALTDSLRKEYKIIIATTGNKALDIVFSDSPPDIVLLDISMPDIDGYEVCKKVKENELTKNIPVIFVTSMQDEVEEAKGFDVGAADYIKKPFSLPVVRARIRTQIELVNYRENVNKQFGILKKFIPDEINNILENKNSIDLTLIENKTIYATVCFIKISGLSKIVKKSKLENISNILNEYYNLFIGEILANNGMVNKFIGDSVFVLFKENGHELNALKTCFSIRKKVQEKTGTEKKKPGVCIGLCTGEMVYGIFGSNQFNRFDYTVIGHAVDMASNLIKIADEWQILTDNTTNKKIKNHANSVEIDKVSINNEKTKIFNISGLKND